MRKPMVIVALLYTSGVLLASFTSVPVIWLFAVSFVLVSVTLFLPAARSPALAVLLVALGWTNLAWRTALISPHDLRVVVGNQVELVTLRGVLSDPPTQRVYEQDDHESWRTLAEVQVSAISRHHEWQPAFGRVAVTTSGVLNGRYFAGQSVEVTGVLRQPARPAAEGLFDYRKYLEWKGIYYQLQAHNTNDWRLPDDSAQLPPPLVDRFTRWSKTALTIGLPIEDEPLRLIWAMALGWQTALTGEVSEPFMRSGTMHIFAISGLHIALIAGILVALLRVAQLPRAFCGAIVIPLIWFYTAATGWQPSAIRSTIMMTVIVLGWSLRRPSDLLNSLMAAAFIILIWEPRQLFQASFQLSFFVVLSIALLMPSFEAMRQRLLQHDPLLPEELRPRWRRWLEWPVNTLTGGLATSLAAWIGSLPLIAYYFHLLTPVSLLANLIIVPLSSLSLMCSLGSLVCAPWAPWLTELFNHSGWLWMKWMIQISDWCVALPASYYYVPEPAPLFFVAYYALLLAALNGWFWPSRLRIAVGLTGALVTLATLRLSPIQHGATRLTVLSLSRGDATFVHDTAGARNLLVDCSTESVANFTIKPFLRSQGVGHVPRLLLTHGDVSNVGGTLTILTNFSVNQVVTSPVHFRSSSYRKITGQLDPSPDHWQQIERHGQIQGWTVLHPEKTDRFAQADDAALVLRNEIHGTRILLLSDLGKLGQRALLEREPDLRSHIVVAGIPRDGEPLRDELLSRIQPRVIIVSASEFPASERPRQPLRDRLATHGVPVFYTSDAGSVTVTIQKDRWEVRQLGGASTRGVPGQIPAPSSTPH